jgi:hypothetical protein
LFTLFVVQSVLAHINEKKEKKLDEQQQSNYIQPIVLTETI